MDQNENNFLVENIIQIFNNNLKFIDRPCIIKVFYKLIEKDKNQEMGLVNIIENILEEDNDDSSDNMETNDVSTKQDTRITNSNNQPTISNSEKFSSSNENQTNSFKDSNEDKSKEISEIAEEIFYLIKNLDEKEIEDILSQLNNYFITKNKENS